MMAAAGGRLEVLKGRYGLTSTLVLSLVVKLALFAIGIAIIGLLNVRTTLPSCGTSSGSLPPVYTSPFADVEAYTDYRDLYLRCLVTPFLQGSSAYNLPIVYNYPPLFLYTLAIFSKVNLIWFSAVPLVLFDALTAVPLYLIAKNYLFNGNSKLAFAVSVIWIANPINLFYNDLMWLNPGPFTFFFILALYFFLRQNWIASAVSLAVSTGFKQISVLLFPILLILLWKTTGFSKKLLLFLASYVGLLVIISAPYIFQNPQQYFWALQLPILGNPPGTGSGIPTTFTYDLSQPTRLTTFLGLVKFADLRSIAVLTYPFLNYVFAGCYAGLLIFLAFGRKKVTSSDLLVYCLLSILLFLSLFGRGTYKYYFASVTPLAIPLYSSKRGALLFEAFSIALVFIPREVTPWLAVLLITFLPPLLSPNQEEKNVSPA